MISLLVAVHRLNEGATSPYPSMNGSIPNQSPKLFVFHLPSARRLDNATASSVIRGSLLDSWLHHSALLQTLLHTTKPRSFTQPSVKFLSLEISSSRSCKSTSLILFCRLGISVFASSALSQHRLPTSPQNQSIGHHLISCPSPRMSEPRTLPS